MVVTKYADAELEQAVSGAIRNDKALSGKDIVVRVRNQTAYLKGNVESLDELSRAERLAMGVEGVQIIDSSLINIRNGRAGREHDQSALHEAEQALSGRPALRDQVHIDIHQGKATLTGSVKTLKEKQEAHQAVSEIKGIVSILNLIETAASEMVDS